MATNIYVAEVTGKRVTNRYAASTAAKAWAWIQSQPSKEGELSQRAVVRVLELDAPLKAGA